jgi:hypothetical protein
MDNSHVFRKEGGDVDELIKMYEKFLAKQNKKKQ